MQTLVSHDIRDHQKTWVERHAICSKCGNEEWQKGDTIGCAKSALIKLKYTCPRGEKNFYFSTSLSREEAEERLALLTKTNGASGKGSAARPQLVRFGEPRCSVFILGSRITARVTGGSTEGQQQ